MPRRCELDPSFPALLLAQDRVVHRDQALAAGLTTRAITHRLHTRQWRTLLPSVYLASTGEPTRRQLLAAASVYAGPDSAIDGADACRFHGIRGVAVDEAWVQVAIPWGSPARSRGFVVVRRTLSPISTVSTEMLRYVGPAQAVIAATRGMTSARSVLAALSDSLQRRITTYDELVAAHVQGPPRGSRRTGDALEELAANVHSVPEVAFRRLAIASPILPRLGYNVWLRLQSGRVVCVDAIIESSAVIHETNGRVAHERQDLFNDMQERHDALTSSGFTVLHNPPQRIHRRGREVIAEVERCHQMYDGRGLPAGVRVLTVAA